VRYETRDQLIKSMVIISLGLDICCEEFPMFLRATSMDPSSELLDHLFRRIFQISLGILAGIPLAFDIPVKTLMLYSC